VKGGKTIHLSERSEDMYASIDLLAHKLQRMLGKYKDKFRGNKNNEGIDFDAPDLDEPIEAADLKTSYSDVMEDKLAGQILKEKAFEMPAMSAAEAAENLEFIDHPFYVFRNKVHQLSIYLCIYLSYSTCVWRIMQH
jgi:putative sigma-54 modulation protein